MTTAREDVAAYLAQETALTIISTIDAVPNAKAAVVMVARSSITPSPLPDTRDDGLTVWLLSPHVDAVLAEADLDANVDALTNAIDRHEFLRWDSGERDIYAEAFHAFRINVTHRTLTKE